MDCRTKEKKTNKDCNIILIYIKTILNKITFCMGAAYNDISLILVKTNYLQNKLSNLPNGGKVTVKNLFCKLIRKMVHNNVWSLYMSENQCIKTGPFGNSVHILQTNQDINVSYNFPEWANKILFFYALHCFEAADLKCAQ